MSRIVVAAMFVALALAGCTEKTPVVEEECEDLVLCDLDAALADHFCIKNDLPRVYAPDVPDEKGDIDPWTQGDYWEYSLAMDGKDHGKTRLVYYDIQDSGAHYMVGTPTREEALEHAVFSINPVIGRVHKTLYSPHESGSHADMFHFPLCDGSTWQDTYFATDFTFTARQATLAIPGGTDQGYVIEGTAEDGSTITHTYSPKVKWFTMIDLERADGLSVDMQMTQYGSGATGEAFFLRGQMDESFTLASDSGNVIHPVDREEGSSGPYDTLGIQIDLRRTAGGGRVEVHVVDPDDQSRYCVGIAGNGLDGATDCETPGALIELPWKEGRWEIELRMPLGIGTAAEADVALASIYDRSGSV